MSAKRFKYDVFLSHNGAQKTWTEALARRLRDDGFNVWFDQWVLPQGLGKDWIHQLRLGVRASHKVVLVWSPEFFTKDWPTFEARIIQSKDPVGRKNRIIPLLQTACKIPEDWAFRQALDFTHAPMGTPEFEFRYQQLIYNLDNSRPYEGDLERFKNGNSIRSDRSSKASGYQTSHRITSSSPSKLRSPNFATSEVIENEEIKDRLEGTKTVLIWISQLFRMADLHIFPTVVKPRRLVEILTSASKMRRVLNHRSSIKLGDLGSLKPVATVSNKLRKQNFKNGQYQTSTPQHCDNEHLDKFENFWHLAVPDFRRPDAPSLLFLPFELSLTERLAAHTYDPGSILGEVFAKSDPLISARQVSGRLRIYPPGVGIIRLGITLTFRDVVCAETVTQVARDVEQLLFVDPNGMKKPCEEVLLDIIDQVAKALFSEKKLGYQDRRWRPPETIYYFHDDASFQPERNLKTLARIMSRAPRNEETEPQLHSRLRGRLESSDWQKDRILTAVGQGVALLFLEASERPAPKRKRKKLLYWLEETAELVSAIAYAEKALLEELERISKLRQLDDSWLPDVSTSFEFLSALIGTMQSVLQSTVLAKEHIARLGPGVLCTFTQDILAYHNSGIRTRLVDSLQYIQDWLEIERQKSKDDRLTILINRTQEVRALSDKVYQ